MSGDLMTRAKDKYVTVDGLHLRYIEEDDHVSRVERQRMPIGSQP